MNQETNQLSTILNAMKTAQLHRDIQSKQTEHRMRLVNTWDIKPGDKVLEIGCGQGDTTAVLAYHVGEQGSVHGVDIAPKTYGSPVTIGESIAYLQATELGKRVSVDFETDILKDDVIAKNNYDTVVLSNCSWYFSSQEQILGVLKKLKQYGNKLCFSEYDMRIADINQYAHFLAIIIQSQWEVCKENSISNIRTLTSFADIERLMKLAGWKIQKHSTVHAKGMDDAKWEIEYTLSAASKAMSHEGISQKQKDLLNTQVSLLEHQLKNGNIETLSSFSIVATS